MIWAQYARGAHGARRGFGGFAGALRGAAGHHGKRRSAPCAQAVVRAAFLVNLLDDAHFPVVLSAVSRCAARRAASATRALPACCEPAARLPAAHA